MNDKKTTRKLTLRGGPFSGHHIIQLPDEPIPVTFPINGAPVTFEPCDLYDARTGEYLRTET